MFVSLKKKNWRGWLPLMEMWMAQNAAHRTGGLMDWRQRTNRSSLRDTVKEVVCLEELIQQSFPSLPESLLDPCGSLYIQRLLGGPCLEVASWRVAVTVRAGRTGRPWHAGLSGKTGRSPLPVTTVLTVAGSAWLTCDDKLILGCYSSSVNSHIFILCKHTEYCDYSSHRLQLENKPECTDREVQEVLADP